MMSNQRFASERRAFAQLRQAITTNPDLKQEVEYALAQLLERFATSIRENRFVVGGALEVILTAVLRAAGVEAEDVGIHEERIDIRIPDGGFSVKGHFSGQGNIRVINVLGDSSETKWEEATIFVLHGVGIGYADPDLLGTAAINRVSDAVTLKYAVLRQFLGKNPQYLISLAVPPALKDPEQSDLVSRAVAREILRNVPLLWSALHNTPTPEAE